LNTLTAIPFSLGYGLDDRGSIPGRVIDGIFFPSPPRPDRMWGLLSPLSNRHRGHFPR